MTRAGQVEIGVIGQVDHGRFVAGGLVGNAQLVVVIQAVGHAGKKIARITLVAVRAEKAEADGGRVGVDRLLLPNVLVKSARAAVQAVGRIVDRELVIFPGQLEFSEGDPVAVTADDRAQVGGLAQVGGEPVAAEGHVVELSVAVGHDDSHHRRAVIHDADADAVFIGQRVKCDRFAPRRFAERLRRDAFGGWTGLGGGIDVEKKSGDAEKEKSDFPRGKRGKHDGA